MIVSPALILAFACIIMSCLAQLAMRHGMLKALQIASVDQASALYLAALFQPWVWLGLGLYGLSAVAWLWVLSRVPVSTAYPLVAFGFVLTMAGGVWLLGEPFTWGKMFGSLLIVLGVILLCVDWQSTSGRSV
jgi:drug/metabolite transporter (DMT)-like permease